MLLGATTITSPSLNLANSVSLAVIAKLASLSANSLPSIPGELGAIQYAQFVVAEIRR